MNLHGLQAQLGRASWVNNYYIKLAWLLILFSILLAACDSYELMVSQLVLKRVHADALLVVVFFLRLIFSRLLKIFQVF